MIPKSLLDKPPERREQLAVVIDLLYCLKQSLAFLRYKFEMLDDAARGDLAKKFNEGHVPAPDLLKHNVFIEVSLMNIRSLNEFFKPKKNGRAADVSYGCLIGEETTPSLTKDEEREIHQLFAHVTANRYVKRCPKENWPVAEMLSRITEKFRQMLTAMREKGVFSELEAWYDLQWVVPEIVHELSEADILIRCEQSSDLNKLYCSFVQSGSPVLSLRY